MDEGPESGAEGATHGVVVTLLDVAVRFGGGGKPGNGFLDDATPEDVPQELVCDTEDLEDCAVEDFSFSTRFDFAFDGEADDEELEVIDAHPKGSDELLMLLGPGRDG